MLVERALYPLNRLPSPENHFLKDSVTVTRYSQCFCPRYEEFILLTQSETQALQYHLYCGGEGAGVQQGGLKCLAPSGTAPFFSIYLSATHRKSRANASLVP